VAKIRPWAARWACSRHGIIDGSRAHSERGSFARLSPATGLSDGRSIERGFAAELAAPVGPMDAPLQDPEYFAQVRVDSDVVACRWRLRFPIAMRRV
jgi:hypothetical protein